MQNLSDTNVHEFLLFIALTLSFIHDLSVLASVLVFHGKIHKAKVKIHCLETP